MNPAHIDVDLQSAAASVAVDVVSVAVTVSLPSVDIGLPGPTGPEGPQGEPSTVPGPEGPVGATGPRGVQGVQGIQGPTGLQGIQGVQGVKGDQGVDGPIGPQGASSGAYPYQYKTTPNATDPLHGYIKTNATGDQAGATELYVSAYDKNGAAVLTLGNLDTGDEVDLYRADQFATWNRYELTAPVQLNGDPVEWVTMFVRFTATGSQPFAPLANNQILLTTPIRGEEGPQGPQGGQGPQGVQGPLGPQGVQGPQGATGATGTTDMVSLTQAEYDALAVKNPSTLYVITDGADRTLLTGPRPPSAGDGLNGDFWIDATAWTISGPKAGSWPTAVPIIGPPGASGTPGLQGTQGIQGVPGATGSPGATGATGATGPTGPQGIGAGWSAKSGRWMSAYPQHVTAGAITSQFGTCYATKVVLAAAVQAIAVQVNALSGGLIRLSVYADSVSGLVPGARVFLGTDISSTTGGIKTQPVSPVLQPGTYWLVAQNTSSGVTPVMIATQTGNPYGPGALASYTPSTLSYGGFNLTGQGTVTPDPWPATAVVDGVPPVWLLQAA